MYYVVKRLRELHGGEAVGVVVAPERVSGTPEYGVGEASEGGKYPPSDEKYLAEGGKYLIADVKYPIVNENYSNVNENYPAANEKSTGETEIIADAAEIRRRAKDERVIVIGAEQFDAFRRCINAASAADCVGATLDGGAMDTLKALGERYAAIRRGVGMVAICASSEARLRDKLVLKGVSRSAAADAAAYIKERGYINEDEQALTAARGFAKKRYGRRRIAAELASRGYGRETIGGALKILDTEVDFGELCAELLEIKHGAPPYPREDAPKIAAQLQRYGHEAADVRRALSGSR